MLVVDDLTLRGRALGDGRWYFDAATLPATFVFGDASSPSVRATLRTDGLGYHATFDPTHATENVEQSTLPAAHAHVSFLDATSPKLATPLEFDLDTGVVTMSDRATPAVGGFVRDTGDSSIERLDLTMPVIAPGARVTIGFVDYLGTTDVSPEGGRAVTAAYNDYLRGLKQTSADKTTDANAALSPATLSPAAQAQLTAMLKALRSALRSIETRTEADAIDVDLGDGRQPYHLDRLVMTGTAAARDGRLDVAAGFELDGPRVPGLPAAYARMMPRHVLIRPHLGGIDIDDLMAAAGTVLDKVPGGEAAGEAFGRALVHKLMADGKLSLSLDTVAIDFDGASVAGSGTIRFAGDDPAGVSVKADVLVTGIDAVTTELASHPETKVAATALVFLKGLGRQDGTTMTWHVDVANGKTLVNGQDLTSVFDQPR